MQLVTLMQGLLRNLHLAAIETYCLTRLQWLQLQTALTHSSTKAMKLPSRLMKDLLGMQLVLIGMSLNLFLLILTVREQILFIQVVLMQVTIQECGLI